MTEKQGKRTDPLAEAKARAQELARKKRESTAGAKPEKKEISVSAGAIERVVDLAFNPTRDKIREVTSIDRIQGRLLPQLDIMDVVWQHIVEIALFRQDAEEYERVFEKARPIPPNLIDEFTYRTAQWQKSVGGANLKSAIDLALAETESRATDEDILGREDAWKD